MNTPPTINNCFASFLQEFQKGGSLDELSEAFQSLCRDVQLTGKPGKLVYTVSITPATRGNSMVVVSDDINVKPPRTERAEGIFFVTKEGALTRNDPSQQEFPALRVVASQSEPTKEAAVGQ